MIAIQCYRCHHPVEAGKPYCAGCSSLLQVRNFNIQRELSSGGMGKTYIALDQNFQDRECVVKELLQHVSGDSKAVELFEREAKVLKDVRHPAIPEIYAYFRDHDRFYIVMEAIDGTSLDELLIKRSEPFSEDEVARWAIQLCEILEYLHRQSPPIIHRDIKPSNVMLAGDQVKLIDFGGVKLATGFTTGVGTKIYSQGYAPPEQLKGEARTQSDLYALGITLLQLLTKLPPEDFYQSGGSIRPIADVAPGLSPHFSALLEKATDADWRRRQTSAAEMIAQLKRVISGDNQVVVTPVSSGDQVLDDSFPDVVIEKSLMRSAGIGDRAIPMFVVEWLISRCSDSRRLDAAGKEKIREFVAAHLPSKSEKNIILNTLVNGEMQTILDAYSVSVDVTAGMRKLQIPCLDVADGLVEPNIVEKFPLLLVGNIWGAGRLERRIEEKKGGKIWMTQFVPMQTAKIDLDYYIAQRHRFSLNQWRELLIRSMGYNPEAYTPEAQQYLLARLIPMVQNRANLLELAPKGTGKSFVFSNLSKHSWLISGGKVTGAQLFYNLSTKQLGLIAKYDTVVFDECQTLSFDNPGEIIGVLKDYLESGQYTRGGVKVTSECSLALLANIPIVSDNAPVEQNYFNNLPDFLGETAFVDRIHGIIPGWKIPKISNMALGRGMGFKADFFGEILHALRNRSEYLDYVQQHTEGTGNLRDIKAMQKIAAAYLKLLFPDLNLSKVDFYEYCVKPAMAFRQLVRNQLALNAPGEFSAALARFEVV